MPCSVTGCTNEKVAALGLCRKHYGRNYRKGPKAKLEERQRNEIYRKKPSNRFNSAKSRLKYKQVEFTLSLKEYSEIIKAPCHYCGIPNDGGGSGLDRIDNNVGYVVGNLVSCCGTCNRMKSDLFLPQFLDKIRRIFYNIFVKVTV